MKFPSFLRLFGERWQDRVSGKKRRGKARRLGATSPRPGVERLEERTLLAVLPTADVLSDSYIGNTSHTTVDRGNFSAPQIAVDPVNPQKMVAFYVRNDPNNPLPIIGFPNSQNARIEGSYTTNGGVSWSKLPITRIPPNMRDPTTPPTAPLGLPVADEPSVAFDRGENIYLVYREHTTSEAANGAGIAGVVVLQKYSFTGNSPQLSLADNVLYAWAEQDPVFNPVVTVDNGVPYVAGDPNNPGFTDPDTGQVQRDPYAGRIYVAWNTLNATPARTQPFHDAPLEVNFNPNTIIVMASGDGGLSFSTQVRVNDPHTDIFGNEDPNYIDFMNPVPENDAYPQLSVSQGTAHAVNAAPTVSEGQLNITWTNYAGAGTIVYDRIQDSGYGAALTGNGGPINDGIDPGNGGPNIPGITDFPLDVSLPTGFTFSDLDIPLSILSPNLDNMWVSIIPPASSGLPTATLFYNRLDATGTAATPPFGLPGGNNLGLINGVIVPAVFDSEAAMYINDPGASTNFTGHFKGEFDGLMFGSPFDGLRELKAAMIGKTAAQLSGTWTLHIEDTRQSTGVVQQVNTWGLTFTSNLTDGWHRPVIYPNDPTQTQVFDNPIARTSVQNTTFVGNYTGPFPTLPGVSPDRGVAPNPVIASNNTLGSFSPNQGDLYIAFTRPHLYTGTPPPLDDTDINLLVSRDGGASWRVQDLRIVNNDNAIVDGFSESNSNSQNGNITGRAQFMPAITVDQTTGTLVVTYYDARNDGSRNRVARYIATSIDGGNSFDNGLSQSQTFLNAPLTALDAIRNQTDVIGPLNDNFSTTNPNRDTFYAMGDRQAVVAVGGRIVALWTGNQNGLNDNPNFQGRGDIIAARATIAAGPRVIDSTMGPVQSTTVLGFTFNNTFAADGTPLADGFIVQFDRPIDPASFVPSVQLANGQLQARAVVVSFLTASGGTPIPIATLPMSPTGSRPLDLVNGGATTFFIAFDQPQSLIGTFSYAILPVDIPANTLGIRDRVRFEKAILTPNSNFMRTASGLPSPVPPVGTGGSGNPMFDTGVASIPVAGRPANEVITSITVRRTVTHPEPDTLTFFLVDPAGARVALTGGDGAVTDTVLAFNGRNPNGTWRLNVVDNAVTGTGTIDAFSLTFTTSLRTLTFQIGNYLDQDHDANAGAFSGTVDPTLATPSIVGGDIWQVPAPRNGFPTPATTQLLAAPFAANSLPLLIPGPRVVSSHAPTIYAPTYDQVNLPVPSVGTGGSGVAAQDRTDSVIPVAGANGTVTYVNATVTIAHARPGDLKLTLIHVDPMGNTTSVVLANGRGGSTANAYTNTTFSDDSFAPMISTSVPPFTGTFRPESPLAAFIGGNANGTWTLRIEDLVTGVSGTLTDWSLTVETTASQSTTDNLILNGTARAIDVVFDRAMDPSSFDANDLIRFVGPLGVIGGPRTYTSPDVPKSIPDAQMVGNQPVPLVSSLVLSETGTVSDLNVQLSINHPRVQDLSAYLRGPDGTLVQLFANAGGATGQNFVNLTIDDSGFPGVGAGVAPFTGTFRPAATFNATGLPLAIPDNQVVGGAAQPLISPLTINNVTNFDISQLSVLLNITHQRVADLKVELEAPDGTRIILVNALGGPLGQDFTNTVFDDASPTPISFGAAPFTGVFRPAQGLAAFAGKKINGTWKLRVTDATTGKVGTLNSWSLSASTVEPVRTPAGLTEPALTFNPTGLPLAIPDNQVVGGVAQPLISPLTINNAANFDISQLTVLLNITHQRVADLKVELEAPDGTRITLVDAQGGPSGQNFTNTVFDDTAPNPISIGTAPFTGVFRPAQSLAAFAGKKINGVWKLRVTDATTGNTGTLNSWSITTKPELAESRLSAFNGKRLAGTWQLLVFDRTQSISGSLVSWSLLISPPGMSVQANPPGTPPALANRTFRVSFPPQDLSGTYQLDIGPVIRSANGDFVDSNLNGGIDTLRQTPVAGTAPVTVSNATAYVIPNTSGGGGTVQSPITFTDDFLIQDVVVQLDIDYPEDPDLMATLIAPDGTRIILFDSVGSAAPAGARQDFQDTVFSEDTGNTPIQQGSPPFTGRFRPQESIRLPLVGLLRSVGANPWLLEIKDKVGGSIGTRRLNSWSLTLSKNVPFTGQGEVVSDQSHVSFRIFTVEATNPLSNNTWTAVGPASINAVDPTPQNPAGERHAGRVSAIAVDPSDPSGNTVYIGGSGGGVWKTTNFLTTAPQGPTYLPLTDFAPTFGLNIGGLAIFARNNDPTKSIIFAGTGDGDDSQQGPGTVRTSRGVGFLRSMDGGATWTLLDSSVNVDTQGNPLPLDSPLRDHIFALGTTAFKVVVDPRPTPAGEVIVYAALSGAFGGIWRSFDTGKTWQLMRAGQATDIVLDPASNVIDAFSNPTGNIEKIFGAFTNDGVYFSPNRGQVWNIMRGITGDPLIQDQIRRQPDGVRLTPSPNGASNRIFLAKPFLTGVYLPDGSYTGNRSLDEQYEGYLYAMVVLPSGALDSVYMTKDLGQNWTAVSIPQFQIRGFLPSRPNFDIPTNDIMNADYEPFGDAFYPTLGNNQSGFAIDPNNPDIVYIGGTTGGSKLGTNGPVWGLIRVDTTRIHDPHAVFIDSTDSDGGQLLSNTTTPVQRGGSPFNPFNPPDADPVFLPRRNLIRRPGAPFDSSATVFTTGVDPTLGFANTGDQVRWIPFDGLLRNSTNVHELLTIRDPLTGKARLIVGDDDGIFTGVDNGDSTVLTNIGTAAFVSGDRNGNLQNALLYKGAVQPTDLAAAVSTALFYGMTAGSGFPQSSAQVLTTGNLLWNGTLASTGTRGLGFGSDVATDQTVGGPGNPVSATVYQFKWPFLGGNYSNFFQVNRVGRTFNLLQTSNGPPTIDPQWDFLAGYNFAVNPLNNRQIIISSGAGRIFGTSDQGQIWAEIGNPNFLDNGFNADALAYGAPQPTDPPGSLNNFLYAGTTLGNIYVTFTGGGASGNQWIRLSAGLDGSPVRTIITNPQRGTREAYAVTDRGVYFMPDSGAFSPVWQRITGSLFSTTFNLFDPQNADTPPQVGNKLLSLDTLVADWRYVIPDNPAVANGPTHPVLYVGGNGGVFRSFDKGQTWELFPNFPVDGARQAGGFLPNVRVTDLDLALGAIDPTTGRPDLVSTSKGTGSGVLVASTFGRGAFAIRLAPVIVPGSVQLDPILPVPTGSDTGSSNTDRITNVITPYIAGLTAQSAFGNNVSVTIFDVTDSTRPPIPIGVGTTDQTGHFSIQVNTGAGGTKIIYFADGSTDGLKRLAVQATDDFGAVGPMAFFEFTIDTTPFVRLQTLMLDPTRPMQFGGSDSVQAGNPFTPGTDMDRITNVNRPYIKGIVDQATQVTVEIFDHTPTTPGGPDPDPNSTRPPIAIGMTDAAGNFSIMLTGAFNPGDNGAVKTIGVRAKNATRTSNEPRFQFTLDTVAPSAPTLNMTASSDTGLFNNDRNTQVRTPTFQGVGEPNALVRFFALNLATSVFIDLGQVLANATGNFLFTVPASKALADGRYQVTSTQTDVAGNVSAAQTLMPNLVVDTTAPVAPTVNLDPVSDTGASNSDHVTKVNRPTFIGTALPAEVGSLIRVFAKLVPGGTNLLVATATVQADGSWTAPFSGGTLSDGTYDITVQETDVAGNNSPVSAPMAPKLVVDTIRPSSPGVPSLDPNDDTGTKGDNVTSVTQPRFLGMSEANAMIQIFGRLLPSGTNNSLGTGTADATGKYSVQAAAALANGTYDITAVQVDVAGNMSVPSSVMTPKLVIDAVIAPPTLDLTTASDSGVSNTDHYTNVTTPTFSGTAEVGATVTVTLRNVATMATVTATGVVGSNGSYTATVTTALAEGVYDVTATQTDTAGNISGPSAPLNPQLVIDVTAPGTPPGTAPGIPQLLAADDTGASGTDRITNVKKPRFTGTGEVGALVVLFANGVQVGSGIVPSSGTYTITATANGSGGDLADGTYQVTARQFDLAGNASSASPAMTPALVIDSVAPIKATLTLDPSTDTGVQGDNTTAAIPQRYTGTTEAGVTLTFLDNLTSVGPFNTTQIGVDQTFPAGGPTVATFRQLTATTFRIDWALQNGPHPLKVQASDVAGNASQSNTLNITISPDAIDAGRKYIRALYRQELGRDGSLPEWDNWFPVLNQTDGRRIVSNGITRSAEARTRLVNSWYQTYLGRPADGGSQGFVTQLVNGASEEFVLRQILGSDEFFARSQTLPGVGSGTPNEKFVRALYQLLMQRTPSQGEVNGWVSYIQANGRPATATQFLTSAEYRSKVVSNYYVTLLGRFPSQAELNGWVFSGLDFTSIRVAFLSSQEYYNRVTI